MLFSQYLLLYYKLGEHRVKVVDGSKHEGIVQIYHNYKWGEVCKDEFDDEDATVLCRMMGYK